MGALEAYILAQRPPAAQARALAVRPRPTPTPARTHARPPPLPILALLPTGRRPAGRSPLVAPPARGACNGPPPEIVGRARARLSPRRRAGGDPAPAAGVPGPRRARVPGAAAAAPRRARVGRPGAPRGRLPRGRAAAAAGGRRGGRAPRGRPPGRPPRRGGPAAAHAAADAAAVPGAGGARGRGRTEAGCLVPSVGCRDAAPQHKTDSAHADWSAGQGRAPGRCSCSANACSLASWAGRWGRTRQRAGGNAGQLGQYKHLVFPAPRLTLCLALPAGYVRTDQQGC